jgi:hypothetical protein
MKISALLFRFVFCGFVAAALSLTSVAQTAAGAIKAARVQGEVFRVSKAGSVPLKDGDAVYETDSVTTGKGASVVLVFMNGSSVRLGSDTSLNVEEFKMDPLAQPISNPTALKNEPSKSKTSLKLSYGEMVGDVKKLNSSSSYSIKTPVGAAGIRGTIYRIVFRPSSDGKAFFTISTAEGKVEMIGVVNTADLMVDSGKEVVVEIDTDNPDKPVVVSQDIAPNVAAAIQAAALELTQTLKDLILTNPVSSGPDEQNLPPPPPPITPPPILTPLSGKA